MDIQLKHIRFYKQLSKETLCFTANVWINGRKVGEASNTGDGGASRFELNDPFNKEMKKLQAEANEYCEQMPDRIIKVPAQFKVPGNEIKAKMDLIEYIDMLIDEEWDKQEVDRVNKWISKVQIGSIIFGDIRGDIFEVRLGTEKHRIKIEDLLNHRKMGREALQNKINEVKTKLKPGQKILNTNIPTEML